MVTLPRIMPLKTQPGAVKNLGYKCGNYDPDDPYDMYRQGCLRAYRLGCEAYHNGISVKMNPYHYEGYSDKMTLWYEGWCDEEHDALSKIKFEDADFEEFQ